MTATEEIQRVSRIGKRPVILPKGVEVSFDEAKVSVKGPKGSLEIPLAPKVGLEKDGDVVNVVIEQGAGTVGPQYQGLMRSLLQNMVTGVNEGYARSLDLHGVGYRAELKGRDLLLNLGLSHQIKFVLPEGIDCKVETRDEGGTKRPRVHLSSCDKQLLGQTAARIRSFRPPEPYKGKGVRYTGERVRMKAGKAGAKG